MIDRFLFRRIAAAAGVVFMILPCSQGLQAQEARFLQQREPSSWQSFPAPPINAGFLFIDGRYVPPPYDIEVAGKSIRINGQEYAEDFFDLSHYELNSDRPMPGMGRMRRGMRRFASIMRTRDHGGRIANSRLDILSEELNDMRLGTIIVLYEGSTPLMLAPTREGHELLQTLCSAASETASSDSDTWMLAPETLPSEEARQNWQRLVSEFQPDSKFLSRAEPLVLNQETVFADNAAGIQANLWRDRISFPLTVFALVVVVLAFGHLLTNAPLAAGESSDPQAGEKARGVIVQSLIFVGLLSAVDLVWTLMAYHSGSMRELNPLGSGLIGDTSQLVLFKVSVTSLAIGLLYWLHQAPLAQRASWWCCLILTLLTARWLTFQSMFL